ncbi:glycosyltransferase family 2 protein [Hyphomicrobium sp.]|uniref:glycosyltransferase family 2 protein n=1 Tax=Hyphomicrobium sp. TaxID=82 RepID=UPI002D76D05F|nr:glycosyltransferase family 2 protein [Hyphomicrobium sp.]HET6391054.1 glycosyltransferase family 2 protein [Hyphomicrobium sp.]
MSTSATSAANKGVPKIAECSVGFPTVSVIVPTLNEARNLPILFARMPDWIHEIVIVDGRSTDNTREVARALHPAVRVIEEPRKGKGAALRAGFNAASGDIIVSIDADGSMNPQELILFVAALMAGADFAKGSRFLQGGGTEDMSFIRMLGNWGLTQIVRVLFGSGFSDLCYGYNAFWKRHLPLFNVACDGFEIETALNLSALRSGVKIIEVPSFETNRIYGESNLNALTDGSRVLWTICKEVFRKPASRTMSTDGASPSPLGGEQRVARTV